MSHKLINNALLCMTLCTAINVQAEPAQTVIYDAGFTLHALTQQVYERLPEKAGEAKFGELQSANEALANAMFAEPMVGNLSVFEDSIVGTNNGMQEWEGSVDMPLWLPGQRDSRQKLADKIAQQLPAYQQRSMLIAAQQVRSLIWDIKLAETTVEQSQQVWQTAQKLEKDVTSRVKAGDLPNTERLLASSNTIEARTKLVSAQASLQEKLKTYQYFTGTLNVPADYQEILSQQAEVTSEHPYIQMQDQYIDMLRSKQDLARYDSAVNPNLSVGMRRDRGDRRESYTNSLGLGISIALNDKRYSQPAVAEAAAELADAQVQRQQLLRDLNAQLIVARESLQSKQDQLALFTEQDKTTQSYFALQKRAFDLGEINLIDLLRSQVLANESHSRLNLLKVEVEMIISNINQILGETP